MLTFSAVSGVAVGQERRRRRAFTSVVVALGLVIGVGLAGFAPADAIPITIVDDAGLDDEPGQKDLNELTVDFAPAGSDLEVTWNWDVISVSGANTGDACALFDTDGDGNANYSLCVIWNNGATYQTLRLYVCGDGAADKCDQSRDLLAEDTNGDGDIADAGEALIGGPYASTCAVSTVADTFGTRGGAQADTDLDTQASCVVELDDFGALDAFLINVCSYPSQVPGSDPSDCVIAPNSGFLTLVKLADPDDGTTFNFDLGAGQVANNGDTSFSINGSGSVDLIGFPAGTDYDLTEVVPSGWQLDSASCVLSNGTSTGSASGDGVVDFEIQVGRETTCTFVDSKPGKLTLVKQVTNDNGGTAVPSDWTLTATGTSGFSGQSGVSASVAAGDYDLSESGPSGYTASDWVCTGGQVDGDSVGVANGDDITCTITNDDDAPSLTLVKQVVNDNGGTAVPGDWTLDAAGYDPAAPTAGTYDLSETGPAGYTLTSLTCDDDPGVQVTQVTVELGETITCIFVNDDDAPSLTLVKQVVNDNGGTAVPGDWTLDAAGYDPAAPTAGTYDLSETGPAGYTLTSLTCDNAQGQVAQVTLGLGEDVTCIFVNDDDAASLVLAKDVVNDNGGTDASGDWTLSAGGNDVTGSPGGAEATDQAGTYDLSETGPAGYTLTSLTCDDDPGVQVTQVTVELGETITCIFVNDDDAPSLTLVKQVVNDNGGTASAGDWTLAAAGYDPLSPQAGTYDLSETGPAGYSLTSLTCDNAGGQVTSVTLGLGEDVTCIFVNDDDAPSLILRKDVINDNGGTAIASDWTLSAGGNNVAGTPAGLEATDQAGTYALAESVVTGYTNTSISCNDDPGVNVTDVTIGLGETIICTFVNDDDAPSLTLVKQVVNDNGGTASAGDWTLAAAGYDPLSPQAGTYDLSETGPAGYSLTSLTCDNAAGQVTSVTLGLGEDVTCIFVNDDDAPSLILRKDVINDNGGTAIASDWTLSAGGNNVAGTPAGLEATDQAGTYALAESVVTGYTNTSISCNDDPGVNVTDVTIGLGETIICTFVNDDEEPSLTLLKVVENGANPGGTATTADFTLTATGPTGFAGTGPSVDNGPSFDAGSYDLSESGPTGYLASDWICVGGSQSDGDTVAIGLGEDVTCTITNTAMGMTTLEKLTNGSPSDMAWNFTLAGPGVDESDSSPPTAVDFGGVKLVPGEDYTICEVGIPAGWTLEWQVDTDGDGVPDTIIPVVTGVNDDPVDPGTGYSRVYDPNYVAPPGTYTNDTRCVNFAVDVGETLAFQINNSFPGGDPRTIGYWKNWNTCTNGNQPQTAASNGGPAAGWFILDDLLNNPGYTIGILQLDGSDCENAVDILDKRSIDDGKKRASDGAYNLASQLLAAQLNLSAGAETCQTAVDAVNAGQTLLAGEGFDGTGNYLKGKRASDANAIAEILDTYNNGNLC